MIVDAHQHYWRIERGDYHWMSPDLGILYRDYLPDDLTPLREARSVGGSVLVQAAETEAETEFLLDLAIADPSALGVVGWVDMAAPDFDSRLDRLIDHGQGLLKGIRPMIQDIPDPNWILRKSLDKAFQSLERRGLVFDALVHPIHLGPLRERLSRHSGLKCVIDHGAKPDIANHVRSAWSDAMSAIASETSAFCKLSGLVTEAGEGWSASDIRPYAGDLIYHFGAGRLIWGSDWPVVNLASDYTAWFDLARECCQRLNEEQKAQVFGENAVQLYQLEVLCLQ